MAYYGGAHFDPNQQYSQQYAQQYASQVYGQPQASMGLTDPQKTTLWMGELEPYMDENWIKQIWYSLGENVQVKMIRDKYSGQNAGYCFVDFGNNASAIKALTNLQGSFIPGTNRPFRLNWASGGGMNERGRDDRTPEFSVFVGDLGSEVTDQVLYAAFQGRFMSLKSAKVVTDPATGGSRGYGFVRFHDETDQNRALTEMQGVYCGTRPMRISMATPKNKMSQMNAPMGGMVGGTGMGGNQPYYPQAGPIAVPQGVPLNQFTDPNNTTVFVGGLSGLTHEDELRSYFSPFGEVTYVKIPPGKGCGFVQYMHRQSAEMAIAQLNGVQIGNSRVRLSWGRAQTDKGYR